MPRLRTVREAIMEEAESRTVAEARDDYRLHLAEYSGQETGRFESWSREFLQAAFFQYVEHVCTALYHQARADAEALLQDYEQSPEAETIDAEHAAAGRIHAQIHEAMAGHMEALSDVVTRLEWHPTVTALQRLLDHSPPPRTPLEPEPPRPDETIRQANERLLRDHSTEHLAGLLHHAREQAMPVFDDIRDHVMAWVLTELRHGANQIRQHHHNLPPGSSDREQQNIAAARTELDYLAATCRKRLALVIDELGVWEQEVGLLALAVVGRHIRRRWRDGATEAEKVAVVDAILDQLGREEVA